MHPQPSPFHPALRAAPFLLAAASFAATSSAQTATPPLIKVESPEVVLPIKVVQETDTTERVAGPDGEPQFGAFLHAQEVTGLSAKSLRIFDDGVEMKIQHFSVEKMNGWEVRDNVGRHLDYSCTPQGIWVGPDLTNKTSIDDTRLHTYLVTYVPPPSPAGSCHRISIRVDRKHSIVYAPDQYCNTKDPLSDPLKGTDIGNKLLAYARFSQGSEIPLTVQVNAFARSADAVRVSVSAEIPANLFERHWDGIHLGTSIAILGLVFNKSDRLVTRFSDAACAPAEETLFYIGSLPQPRSQHELEEQSVIPGGYRTQLDLDPGDYQLQLLLTDGQKFGRASTAITVDDFGAPALSVSGIALCKRYHKPSPDERGPTRAPQHVPLMFEGQEFTPAGNTQFKKGEQLLTYVEIYGSELRAPAAPKLFMEMKVFDEKTNELRIGTGVRPVDSPMRPDHSAIPLVWEMEVAKLPPGSYRLEAQASDSAGNKTPWRATTFSVE